MKRSFNEKERTSGSDTNWMNMGSSHVLKENKLDQADKIKIFENVNVSVECL